jgi:hypothetical protein
MSIIPLHIQRRFDERWAARFGSLAMPAVPKYIGLKGSPVARRSPKAKEKPERLSRGLLSRGGLKFGSVALQPNRLSGV